MNITRQASHGEATAGGRLCNVPGAVRGQQTSFRRATHAREQRKEVPMAKKTNNANRKETQTFSIAAPTALSVQLVGDFTGWQERPINLRKGPDGIWRGSVELKPGTHHYRFLVDGQWCDDPECHLHVPNPYGSQDAVRQVT
jgi:1,4-alpha-glucan branching enzyme